MSRPADPCATLIRLAANLESQTRSGQEHGATCAARQTSQGGRPGAREVGQEDAACARPVRDRQCLLRSEMAALLVVLAGIRQGRLHDQQVNASRRAGQALARPRVAGIENRGARGVSDADAPGRDVVSTSHEVKAEGPDAKARPGL